MSWFSDRWGQGGPFGTVAGALQGKQRSINALRGDLGNIVSIGSDIAAPFTGPFAPLVAGAGNALGTGIKPGTNIGDIAKSGGIAAGVAGVGAALGGAYSGGPTGPAYGASASPADLGLGSGSLPAMTNASVLPAYNDVASSLGANAPTSLGGGVGGGADYGSQNTPWTDATASGESAGPSVQSSGIGSGPGAMGLTAPNASDPLATAASASAPSPLGTTPVGTGQGGAQGGGKGLLSSVGSFLGKNPNLTGNALMMIGNAPLNEARAKQIALENQMYQQRLQQNASLDPLRQALAAAFAGRMKNPPSVAPNPYYKGTGAAPNPYGG